jgi:hypothetical protein
MKRRSKRAVCGGSNREVKEGKRRVGLVNNRKNVGGWMEGKEQADEIIYLTDCRMNLEEATNR